MSRAARCAIAAGTLALAASIAGFARANPEPLPFSYVPETLEKGQLEVEQYVDFVPTKARSGGTAATVNYAGTQLQTELEYGITSRLELGLYAVVAPQPSAEAFTFTPDMPEGTGLKQRLKYHFTPDGFPVGMSAYLELVEKQAELELEGKLILGARFGKVRGLVNLVAEREFYFDGEGETVFTPSAGLVYQASYTVQPGLEAWTRVELPDDGGQRVFAQGPHVYVGPTILLQWQKLWWSTGFYFRVTDVTRAPEPGDAFGKIWLRVLVGVPL